MIRIVTAGSATGFGIWATHFIAMLAYDPGVGIAYNIALDGAFAAGRRRRSHRSASAIAVMRPSTGGHRRSAARIVGAGVACMHYLGMWAVELPGRVQWHAGLVAASILIGMRARMAASSRRTRQRWTSRRVLLTLAIVSHHFTAMGAVEIVPDPTRMITVLAPPMRSRW